VNQQSEHLSSAQIEEYGSQASGAGPETEKWVEEHLADCSRCRGRVLDFQRTRFALLPDPKVNTVPTSDCPSEDELRDLAAGLCSEPTAQKLKDHAATCKHCGPLLQEYTEDFSNNFTPEEQAILDQLSSASPAWQRQKALEMLEQNQKDSEPLRATFWRRFFSSKWMMVPVTAVVALIATSIWYIQRDTPKKVEKMLAQAYTDRRTLEMRFPGAAYSGYKQTLSGDSESLLNSPESLRKAADLIDSQLKKNPDDPHWLLLSARLNLLDWRYKPALAILDKIEDPNIIDSADMRMTQGLALYEQAEFEPDHRDEAYSKVVNLMGQILQKTPTNPAALFNQATACEKLYMYECASADYDHLLQIEKDDGWANEARQRLNNIKEKKNLLPRP
jgi:tetratricopeptide (TPR) repeat protein